MAQADAVVPDARDALAASLSYSNYSASDVQKNLYVGKVDTPGDSLDIHPLLYCDES